MNDFAQPSGAAAEELFLSNAYRRMQRMTVLLGIAAAIAAALWSGWRAGVGTAIGALVGYLNFVWLHQASIMMTERMIAPAASALAKLKIMVAFGGRYGFVIAMSYVIFKSQPKMLAGYTAALFLPIAAATAEGIYEAFAGKNQDKV